jgi:hypothetical protein
MLSKLTNYSYAKTLLTCKTNLKAKSQPCVNRTKSKTFLCKAKHKQQIWWFQNPKNLILITQIPTYPKHEKFEIVFTLESVPTLFIINYLW